ncbi:hypothetical protein BDBG_18011 [Blastomyces gilchristii SLH14081]|uniref:Uncharacterized protein n=1 Tax=Blastomyces gilchristii (strain SLH14081) TaxID=559298 RepID=A0A179V261_BLAGS|nr:uncharacterized protein BDBG_18011 [Blastomyces gilchristii SLH14081]OAT14396.1 hypothetical protein BDBG_18011 [Blastomyces gilchristii SLH14081]
MIRMMKRSLISLEYYSSIKTHSVIMMASLTPETVNSLADFSADTTLHEYDSLKTLGPDQHLLHNTILYHYTEILNSRSSDPLLINLDSKDDTDKTYLIMILSTTLQNLAEAQDLSTSIIQAMSTDVAAYFINT